MTDAAAYGANVSPDVIMPNPGGPPLALRRLSLGLVNDPGFQRQLPLEVNTLRGLNEPLLAVPTSFLLDDSGRVVAVVRRHVPGTRLSRVLDRYPRGLDSQTATVIAVDVLTALSALHARWVGHRAVSAENIVIDAAGRCVLVDVGLAPRVLRETLDSTVAADLAWFADLIVHCLAGHPGGHRRRPASRLKGAWLPRAIPEPLRSVLRSALHPSRGAASAAATLAELRSAAARRFDADWDVRAHERLAASSRATATTAAAATPIPASLRSAARSTPSRSSARRRHTKTRTQTQAAVRTAIAIALLGGGAAAGVYTSFNGGHPATLQNKNATSSASKPAAGAAGPASTSASRTPAPPTSASARPGAPGTPPSPTAHPPQPTATTASTSAPGTTTVVSLSLIELAYQDEYQHEAVVIVQVDTSGTGPVALTLKIAASNQQGVADSSPSTTASFPLQGKLSYRITYQIHSAQYCSAEFWGVTAATSPLPSATVYAQLPSPYC